MGTSDYSVISADRTSDSPTLKANTDITKWMIFSREPFMYLHNHLLKPAPRLSLEFPYIKASPPKLTIFFHFWWEDGNKVRVLSEWRVLFSPSKYHQFFPLSPKPQESYPGCTSLQTFTLCVTEYFVSVPKLKKAFCNWCLVLLLEFFSVAHQPSELEIALFNKTTTFVVNLIIIGFYKFALKLLSQDIPRNRSLL